MAEHTLKTLPPYFEAVWAGEKPFEVRKNDRGFQTGDLLTLWETPSDPWKCGSFPCSDCNPRWVKALVTYVFSGDPRWPALQLGVVVLGLRLLERSEEPPVAPPIPTKDPAYCPEDGCYATAGSDHTCPEPPF